MIDLHIHSRFSDDGEYTPEELVSICSKQGIQIMSITDHNCVQANEAAQLAAQQNGIRYISGIEIDCVYGETNLHILGYGIDFHNSIFKEIEKNIEDQSLQASIGMLSKTQALGFHITENEMWNLSKDRYNQNMWTGEMFAEVLLSKPEYQNHPLLNPYRQGGMRSDNPYVNFYWDYYSQGKKCFVGIRYPRMEEVIRMIQETGGVAVLAHPGVNLKDNVRMLDDILESGIDGIEAYSSYHTPVQAAFFYQKVCEKKLFTTYGSDFHGKTKPLIHIAEHGCMCSEKEMLRQMKKILNPNRIK